MTVPETDSIVPEMGTDLALGATLFGRTRERVLGPFFSRLDEAFYVREVVGEATNDGVRHALRLKP